MAKWNYNRKNWLRGTTGTTRTALSARALGLGAVPAGKTRYITFLMIQNFYGGQQNVVFGTSTSELTWQFRTATTTRASLDAKASNKAIFRVQLQAKEKWMMPPGGPSEEGMKTPLFSIAAGKCLGAVMNRGTCNIFMHYYDK